MAHDEGPVQKRDRHKATKLPERLDPVVPALPVQLAVAALQDADVAGEVGSGCAVCDLRAHRGLGEPAWGFIVKERIHPVHDVSVAAKRDL